MSQKMKFLLVCCLGAMVAAPAYAEDIRLSDEVTSAVDDEAPFTSNVTVTNNYLYRGISQTGAKPAIQGGADYEMKNGFYAGVWGSSISWLGDTYQDKAGTAGATSAGLELDTYLGFKQKIEDGLMYDVGFLRYNFPGNYAVGVPKADTNELFGSVGYQWISAKYSYSLGNLFGNANTSGTNYLEVNASYKIESEGMALGAHYGKQTFKGTTVDAAGNSLTYSDYKVSVTKELDNEFELSLAYSNTNASAAYTVLGNKLGKGAAVISLTRVF